MKEFAEMLNIKIQKEKNKECNEIDYVLDTIRELKNNEEFKLHEYELRKKNLL